MKGRATGSSDDADDTSGPYPYLLTALGDTSPSRLPCIDCVDNAHLNADATARSSKQISHVRPSSARSRRPANSNWNQGGSTQSPNEPPIRNSPPNSTRAPLPLAHVDNMTHSAHESEDAIHDTSAITEANKALPLRISSRCHRPRGPWSVTGLAAVVTMIGMAVLGAILNSSWNLQLDQKGCRMSYMRPSYIHLSDFDTEHTRFATKYSLHLYREQGVDDGRTLKGVPVLFIPGNAGSYRQVRPIAAEAARYYHEYLETETGDTPTQTRNLDFFTVDFNEDITAFHGQTLLDQAEYLNEAIRYILSLYLDPRTSSRDAYLPEPSSVLILGHSMGGIVARTMLTTSNYQANSINTIITMSAPHSRPPVTFDSQIVQIYDNINHYWRKAYSQKWANENPLWHVTLISIAGGGLDTVVPSDYASVESLVPETHGFTVFTTGIPTVWTSMDHQAILWCDQFRKVVTRAMYDVIDVHRSSQTRPRAERMRVFRKWFMTGLEGKAEKRSLSVDPTTLLSFDTGSNDVKAQGERLVIRQLGQRQRPEAHVLPIPPPDSPEGRQFTLLTDLSLDKAGEHGKLEVLLCSVVSAHSTRSMELLPVVLDLSTPEEQVTKLVCRNAAHDSISLPASTNETWQPFALGNEPIPRPFTYLQYNVEDLLDHQFVVVVDKTSKRTKGFLVAEFHGVSQSHKVYDFSLRHFMGMGVSVQVPALRPMTTSFRFPALQSSLLAYSLDVGNQACTTHTLFAPLMRQHLSQPHESKFFVNTKHADISIHGIAPFVPPPMSPKDPKDVGLTLQFWTDPTCESAIDLHLAIDIAGSLGKLYMRYRTIFAAFPLLVVTLVLRKQFQVYDATGVFISFTDSLDRCLRQSLPLMFLSLTLLSLSLRGSDSSFSGILWDARRLNPLPADFHSNDLLTGTQDPFFWYLMPLIGVVCVGVCATFHYVVVVVVCMMGMLYGWVVASPLWHGQRERQQSLQPAFSPSPPRRRALVIAGLLILVTTCIPYQFAYLVACLCQLLTSMRSLRTIPEARSPLSHNFYNYSHSVLLLMLWVLPINMPILVVWLRNIMVQWLTPFSSHHNVLSIMPFLLLVENLSTGNMVPRIGGASRHLTSILLFTTAVYAALYGVSYAYMLHYLVNIVAVWLVLIHATAEGWALTGIGSLLMGRQSEQAKEDKAP